MAKRVVRQLAECYYEGYLEKRSFKDKVSRKLWTCLCGNALFFFNDKKDAEYIEKVDLSELISITDDGSKDQNLSAARLKLLIKDGDIRVTAPSTEARELWKGYIHAVTQLAVPSSLNLLPGQVHMLREAVEKETKRRQALPPPAGSTPLADMPACYRPVSRVEAELLLDREPSRGNLLLRPGRDGNSFAVSTRQDLGGSVFRHYRVGRKPEGGFTIDVDDPADNTFQKKLGLRQFRASNKVPCATLHDVISYLVEKTEGALVPLVIEEAYAKNICFIQSDKENGEKTIQHAASNTLPPSVPPKPASLKPPSPDPAPEEPQEHVYQNEMPVTADGQTQDTSAAPQPPPKKMLIPPCPAPRKKTISSSASSSTSSTDKDKTTGSVIDPLEQTLSELKVALEKRRAVK